MIRSDILAESLHKNHSLISLCEGETAPYRTVKLLFKRWACDNLPCHLPKMLSTQGQNHRTCPYKFYGGVLMCLDVTPARPGNEANIINKLVSGKHLFIAFSGTRCFLRASDRERHFLADFFSAGGKEVSRQKGEKIQFNMLWR
jgi:hypothetical protein